MANEALFEQIDVEETTQINDTLERFLTFVSDGLTYGVSTNFVMEIITNHTITPLPMVPDFVKGIINLRGLIIPVIDIRLRLGKSEIPHTSTSCMIVFNINSIPIGIIVDSVSQVLDIDSSKLSKVPTKHRQELVKYMISLNEKEVIFLLDCEELVNSEI
jgi:purine-binding chemotaxis protein CheW